MEVTLYYSPFFTGETYRTPNGKPRFEKIVGDAGLLEFLELRLGLSGKESGAIDRLLAYRKALGDVQSEAFYVDAYGNDPLATAKEILRWRDLLVMEGFDPKVSYASSRLQKLAEVEALFHEPGNPERWKLVHERVKGALPGVKIVVRHDLALLPRLIRETLERLGVTEGLAVSGKAFDAEGKSIAIWNFGTVAEAFQWAVDNHRDETVVCPDPFRLNAVLRNRGKAVLAASAGGDSSILQFFRLGLSLLERPVNVKNLLEYLRNGFSPIPGEQRYDLAWVLKTEGGRGKKWTKALEDCKGVSEVDTFLKSLLDAKIEKGMVSKSVVSNWCEAVPDAVSDKEKKLINEGNKSYVAVLFGLCDGMCRILEKEPSDEVSVDFVQKAVKTLYTLSPVRTDEAMAQGWDAVDSHRSLVDSPEKLWWLPCNGGLATPYPYSFLLKEEMDELHIKSMIDFVRYDFARMADVLGAAKEIVLFTCDFDGVDPLAEHPAVTLCKQAAELVLPKQKGSTTGVFKPLRTIETGVDLYPKDVDLSATSIETLIGYPFDFTMARKLHFHDLNSLQLSDLRLTQGTVSHLVFQRMLEDTEKKTPGSIPDMRSMLEGDAFKERVLQAAKEKGELLLLPENRTLFAHFTETIRKSIGVLLDILQNSGPSGRGLKPRKSEEELKGTLRGYDITGSVDFYAAVNDEEIVVIDFKYSKGKSYIAKLEENESIQLEIYAEGLEKMTKKKVVARAYYFFPINQLHTDDPKGIFQGHGVIPHTVKSVEPSLCQRIWDSVAERETELKKGTLEAEEGIPVDEIAYHTMAVQNNLIDIPQQKVDGKEVKSGSPFVHPTKYPILKNVIK